MSINKFYKCLKLYLSMEEWFHEPNLKEEVMASRPLVAQTIQLMMSIFPRVAKCGWKLPNFHGLTKFVMFTERFCFASTFFGVMVTPISKGLSKIPAIIHSREPVTSPVKFCLVTMRVWHCTPSISSKKQITVQHTSYHLYVISNIGRKI